MTKAVVSADTKVYKKASTSSSAAKVKKGTMVDILKIEGDWAYIRSESGVYAYIKTKYLSTNESDVFNVYMLDEAIDAFRALGSYQDSKKLAAHCRRFFGRRLDADLGRRLGGATLPRYRL